jgi:hypothetical protein
MAATTTDRPKISPIAQQIATELGETTFGPTKQIDVIVQASPRHPRKGWVRPVADASTLTS